MNWKHNLATATVQNMPGGPTEPRLELVPAKPRPARRDAPVFVLGCVRSGTTLLYHMLLSAGDFAVYRTESNALNLLEPRFGDLSVRRNQEKLLDAWFNSKLFWVSGLSADEVRARVHGQCRNGGDFLRIVMDEMARKQGVRRWAECTPEHILHLRRIKQTIPNALILHIIRDGRDVALSAEKQHYVKRAFWDKMPSTMVAGLYWEWMVKKGRQAGRKLGGDYMEVRFEDLVSNPRATLGRVGSFIDHDLDYDRIRQVGIGSVSDPNTSFRAPAGGDDFAPVGRWKQGLPPDQLAVLEGLVGNTLQELGYDLAADQARKRNKSSLDSKSMRQAYLRYFDLKLYLKSKTPLGKMLVTRDLSWV